MTEKEWVECQDAGAMLHFLRERVNDRKLRLFMVACCRRVDHCLPDRRGRDNVAVNERFADGLAGSNELEAAWRAADQALDLRHNQSIAQQDAALAASRLSTLLRATGNAREVAVLAARAAGSWARGVAYESNQQTFAGRRAALRTADEAAYQAGRLLEEASQAALARCLFGNPFRPVTVDPAWRTSTVVSIAQAIYEERAFARLPILADALEDAGCDNADILNHCRQPGDHVRGCWVVDSLLDRHG